MDLYSEIILDRFKHPKNKGTLTKSTHQAKAENPLCGDKLKIQLEIKSNKVTKAQFTGEGCAISQASADILCDHLIGKNLAQVKKLTPQDINKLLGINISPGRAKCALLSLETTKSALK